MCFLLASVLTILNLHIFSARHIMEIFNKKQYEKKIAALVALLTIGLTAHVETLDNGLARKPPMGWLSWERFRCNTDCDSGNI